MTDHSCRCKRLSARPAPAPAADAAGEALPPKSAAGREEEPAMRRWPHPAGAQPLSREDAALHYVRSALSYQNQTLADIKALLEHLLLELRDRQN